MKIILAAAIALSATFVSIGASSAMTIAPPATGASMAQDIRYDCDTDKTTRCKWYGMPGVHHGPIWLRQHGGMGYRRHHHSHRRPHHHQ